MSRDVVMRLSRALCRLGGKIVERDALGHDLAMEHREPVLLGQMAGAACISCRSSATQHQQEQHDQRGDEQAQVPFRDREPEALGQRRTAAAATAP